MGKKSIVLLAAAVALTALGAGIFVSRERATMGAPAAVDVAAEPPAAEFAPDPAGELVAFSLHDMEGRLRDSAEWDGSARLINFWATWCAPCRREIPLLMKTQEDNAPGNLQVIGIAVDYAEDVAAYAEDTQFNYPILVGQEDAMAVAEQSGVAFIGLPFTLIVAPSGELLAAHVGEIMESHIDAINAVFGQLADGRVDVSGAREALAAL